MRTELKFFLSQVKFVYRRRGYWFTLGATILSLLVPIYCYITESPLRRFLDKVFED